MKRSRLRRMGGWMGLQAAGHYHQIGSVRRNPTSRGWMRGQLLQEDFPTRREAAEALARFYLKRLSEAAK